MRPGLPLAIALMLVSLAPGQATTITWGGSPIDVSGTQDPAIAVVSAHVQWRVDWFDGSPLHGRTPPGTHYVDAFHVVDAPATPDPARMGASVRQFTVAIDGGRITTEYEYDLDGDGVTYPDERMYRAAVGATFADANYGDTNTVLAIDAQRPDAVWIDVVDIHSPSANAATLGFTDLGFEDGTGTAFSAWTAGNDLEPPLPVRDIRLPHAGSAMALLPISNAPASGDRPTIQQTVTGIPDKTLGKDEDLTVEFQAYAPDGGDCGVHVRTWDGPTIKDDLAQEAAAPTTWALMQFLFAISEKSDDIEITIFCKRPASFTDATQADLRLFLVAA